MEDQPQKDHNQAWEERARKAREEFVRNMRGVKTTDTSRPQVKGVEQPISHNIASQR